MLTSDTMMDEKRSDDALIVVSSKFFKCFLIFEM